MDDLYYLVITGVDAVKKVKAVRSMPTNDQDNIMWSDTEKLNKLCAGKTACRVTICRQDDEKSWRVFKQGVWQVYGAPFDLSQQSPQPSYPIIHFNLLDSILDSSFGEMDIYMTDGDLFCLELFESDLISDRNVEWKRRFKSEYHFEPVSLTSRLLFQGSITFASLADTYNKNPRQHGKLSVTMVGATGRGRASVTISSSNKHIPIIDNILNRSPSSILIRLINISIHVDDDLMM